MAAALGVDIVTYPGPDAAPPGQRPLPVAFLYNGFQLNSGAYDAYASRLASHGVVVLRYDTPFGKILTDTAELPLSQLALEALETQAAAGALPGLEGGRVSEQSPLAAIGHSRGGKFVALQLGAATSTLVDGRGRRRVISAAVMIDPNDSSRFTKDKPGYESGVAALATTALPVLVVGADVIGRCNPDGSNWKEFARAAPAGSWVEVVQGAGHLEFAEVSWAFRLLCPRGTTRPADAIERALAPTVAAVLRGVADVAPEACGLWDWVARETEAGTITWSETKDGGAPEGGHAVRVADGRQGIDAGEPASAK
ncbi:unnamed protein product [Pedinophyceae sp. YPF-701]|nr:unnamed protein product [Pedinophyceae sp. YPF-701]